jgi:hypothetical protein
MLAQLNRETPYSQNPFSQIPIRVDVTEMSPSHQAEGGRLQTTSSQGSDKQRPEAQPNVQVVAFST